MIDQIWTTKLKKRIFETKNKNSKKKEKKNKGIISNLRYNGGTGSGRSSKNQVGFCSNRFCTIFHLVQPFKVAISIKVYKLCDKWLQVLGSEALIKWQNFTVGYRL